MLLCGLFSYQGVLTLIRAKAEDSGNYTIRAEIGSLTTSYNFYLQVKGGTFFFLYLQVVSVTPLFTYIYMCLLSPLLAVDLSRCTSISFFSTLYIYLLMFFLLSTGGSVSSNLQLHVLTVQVLDFLCSVCVQNRGVEITENNYTMLK